MNIPEGGTESSCSSCKRQENGDSTTEADRPMKKARFAWQVKGKYHLKNEISHNKSSDSAPECSIAGSCSENEGECKKMCSTAETNLEILGDLFQQDLCTLDSMTKSDQQILPNSKHSDDDLPYFYSESYSTENEDNEYDEFTPEELEESLKMRREVEATLLASWQSRQMTKCSVDNAINNLIEGWIGPMLIDDDIEDNNDDSIENEGILMAISAHGLQNTSSSSDFNTDNTSSNSKPFLSPPSSPRPEDFIDLSTKFTNENIYVEEMSKDKSQKKTDFAYSPCDNNKNEKGQDFDTINNNYSDNENSHYDFLDTAVSFAIQYKGLTSYGTDYG